MRGILDPPSESASPLSSWKSQDVHPDPEHQAQPSKVYHHQDTSQSFMLFLTPLEVLRRTRAANRAAPNKASGHTALHFRLSADNWGLIAGMASWRLHQGTRMPTIKTILRGPSCGMPPSRHQGSPKPAASLNRRRT